MGAIIVYITIHDWKQTMRFAPVVGRLLLFFSIANLQPCSGHEPTTVRVIVLDYDPALTTKGNVRLTLHQHWQDPEMLTKQLVRSLKEASGGFAHYQVVDFLHVNEYPQKRDGFTYSETSFLALWADKARAHQPDAISYAALFRRHHLLDRIRREQIREVWLWGAPYFGADEYAVKIPGDRVYYPSDNPWFYRPYDIPDCGQTIWVMGFSYERGEAEALHSFGHRVEGILALTIGRGVWDHRKNPNNPWTRFTRLDKDFPGSSQVGNVHFPPNGKSDYDYDRKDFVTSGADDWLKYPKLTGETRRLNCEAWGGPDYHCNYMKWWLRHLPRADGTTGGTDNNWWQYVVNYDDAVGRLPPPGGRLQPPGQMMH